MAVKDQKLQVLSQIAALRSINDNFPKLKLTNSFPSVNNTKDPQTFLIDLLKVLIGYEELRNTVVDILTYEMDKIEVEIKKALKLDIKGLVSCGINPSPPSFIQSTGPGVDLKLNKIDFSGIMKVDPTTEEGALLYNDVPAQLTSTDFNTFLFYTIQSPGTLQSWNNILDIQFNPNGPPFNNAINVKINSVYDTKTLTDLNNDFIDSIDLFPDKQFMANIIDSLFGTISFKTKKDSNTLLEEEKINHIINNIINSDEEDVIDDSYFAFSNDIIADLEQIAKNRSKGITLITTCNNAESTLALSSVTATLTAVTASGTLVQKKTNIDKGIESLAEESAGNVGSKDKHTAKLNFIEKLLRKIIHAIVNILLSPKLIFLFAINHKIINGIASSFDGPVDFIKKNKTLIKQIMKSIKKVLFTMLLAKIVKEINALIAKQQAREQIEKLKLQQLQMLSLFGVPIGMIDSLL